MPAGGDDSSLDAPRVHDYEWVGNQLHPGISDDRTNVPRRSWITVPAKRHD